MHTCLTQHAFCFFLFNISGIKTKPKVYSKQDKEKYKKAHHKFTKHKESTLQTDRIKKKDTQSNKENASGLQTKFILLGLGATPHSLELKAAHEEVPLDI